MRDGSWKLAVVEINSSRIVSFANVKHCISNWTVSIRSPVTHEVSSLENRSVI